LFVYSKGVGGTSQEGYNEINYLQLYPSAHDGLHPFASYVRPVNEIAHPVLMYDEPIISVVIPVGPGHINNIPDALDSVESQREFRKWEAIVVNDSGETIPEHITKAYPYVKWMETDGKNGPGVARNKGAAAARAKFLVFLDADDMLMPDFMTRTLEMWANTPSIIYTDYIGSAVINEEEAERQRHAGKLRSYSGPDNISIIGYPSREPEKDFDCAIAQAMPRIPLYHWCLVTCLIPTAWHNEIGGFDEQMESWEDVDYHWRMAWSGKCYARVKEELILYRFGSGTRRSSASSDTEEGRQMGRNLLRYIEAKKERIEMAGCSGCGSNRSAPVIARTATTVSSVQAAQPNDQEFDYFYYQSPNRGDHRVIGGNVFPQQIQGVRMIKAQGGGFRVDYGYHPGGDPKPFLVHVADAALQPGFFQKASTMREAPPVERPAPHEPQPVQSQEFVPDTSNNVDPLANFANKVNPNQATPKPAPLPGPTDVPPNIPLDVHSKKIDPQEPIKLSDFTDEFDLQTVPGITATIADQLEGRSRDQLKAMSHDDWTSLKGVADVKADLIMAYLKKLE
jgi:glycosyltransferase involved in cell wall biosynthesis